MRKRFNEESGLCLGCHRAVYPRGSSGRLTAAGRRKLAELRPEEDYQIKDEVGRIVWASDLIIRYLKETRPVGRMSGGF